MDNREFKRLADLYLDTVYRIALGSCGSTADAEDIVQNTFVKLLEYKKKFRDDEHAKRWLIRVAVNEGHMLWRKRSRERTIPLEDAAPLEEMASFSEALSQDESDLLAALDELPRKYRQILHLFYFEGYSSKEIAQILEISDENVRTRLQRARKQLKEILKGDWE